MATPMDILFMMGSVLENGGTRHYNAAMFRRKTSAFENGYGRQWMLLFYRELIEKGWKKFTRDLLTKKRNLV